MLNFAFLFDLLIIYLVILVFIRIVKLFKPVHKTKNVFCGKVSMI